jgi:hypothetical protein|tara:strand:- start:4 stop:150 length:147 start_codon:yes stop_codon:yes gene_type:complete
MVHSIPRQQKQRQQDGHAPPERQIDIAERGGEHGTKALFSREGFGAGV